MCGTLLMIRLLQEGLKVYRLKDSRRRTGPHGPDHFLMRTQVGEGDKSRSGTCLTRFRGCSDEVPPRHKPVCDSGESSYFQRGTITQFLTPSPAPSTFRPPVPASSHPSRSHPAK